MDKDKFLKKYSWYQLLLIEAKKITLNHKLYIKIKKFEKKLNERNNINRRPADDT